MGRPGSKKKIEQKKLEAEVDNDLDMFSRGNTSEYERDLIRAIRENTKELKELRSVINLKKIQDEQLISYFRQAEITKG